jgi:poly-gamma-glutamate synthesis protein (capsule biosynthesis protein)
MVLHKANEAPSPDDPRPAAFEIALFHAAVDAGADVVLRTGPHTLDGVEIYKGRPIFYGLGSLFYDFGGRRSYTTPAGEVMTFPDAWFETAIPATVYKGGRLSEIRLYPMVLSTGDPATSGVPHPADPEQGRRILERIRAMSAPFGATIEICDGVGIIRGPGS